MATPTDTSTPKSGKRKRGGSSRSLNSKTRAAEIEETLMQLEAVVDDAVPEEAVDLSLADRVKRRRRGTVSTR